MKSVLKCAIAALMALVVSPAFGCPTCVGRLMLGVKKPFFEQYKPKPINKRRHKPYSKAQQKKDMIKHRADFATRDFWIRLKKQIETQRVNGGLS